MNKNLFFFLCLILYSSSTSISKSFSIPSKTSLLITPEAFNSGTTVKHLVSTNSSIPGKITFYTMNSKSLRDLQTDMKREPPSHRERFCHDLDKKELPTHGTYMAPYFFVAFNNDTEHESLNFYVNITQIKTTKYWAYTMLTTSLVVLGFFSIILVVASFFICFTQLWKNFKRKKYPELYDIKLLKKNDITISNECEFIINEYLRIFIKGIVAGLFSPYFIVMYLNAVSNTKKEDMESINKVQSSVKFKSPLISKKKKERLKENLTREIRELDEEQWFKLQEIKMKRIDEEKEIGSDLEKAFGYVKGKQPLYYTPLPQSIFLIVVTLIFLIISFPIYIFLFVGGLVMFFAFIWLLGDSSSGDGEFFGFLFLICGLIVLVGLVGVIAGILMLIAIPFVIILEISIPNLHSFLPFRISSNSLRKRIHDSIDFDKEQMFKDAINTNNIEVIKLLLYSGMIIRLEHINYLRRVYSANEIYMLVKKVYEYYKVVDPLIVPRNNMNIQKGKSKGKELVQPLLQDDEKFDDSPSNYGIKEQIVIDENAKNDFNNNESVY